MFKSKETGLPYVLKVSPTQEKYQHHKLSAILFGALTAIELYLAVDSYVNLNQLLGASHNICEAIALAGTMYHGIKAEDTEKELEKNK